MFILQHVEGNVLVFDTDLETITVTIITSGNPPVVDVLSVDEGLDLWHKQCLEDGWHDVTLRSDIDLREIVTTSPVIM